MHSTVRMQSPARSPARLVLLVSALLAPMGCDGDEPTTSIDVRDAEAGWYAANHAVAVGQVDLLDRVDAGEIGDILVRCPDGGRLRLVGESNDQSDFQLDAMFEDCIDAGVMMSGDLTIVASVGLGEGAEGELPEDGGSAELVVDYQGRLRLDGDIEGSCGIDVHVRAPAVAYSGVTNVGVTVEGTVCGHDAFAVVHGQGHR